MQNSQRIQPSKSLARIQGEQNVGRQTRCFEELNTLMQQPAQAQAQEQEQEQ